MVIRHLFAAPVCRGWDRDRLRALRSFGALLPTAVIAVALSLAGCYEDNCELRGTCPPLQGENVAIARARAHCDPTSEDPQDGCGVFVSSSKGAIEHAGTRISPLDTFEHAIELATLRQQTDIYACAEEFHETIVLPKGFRILGGFDCEHGWNRFDSAHKTEVIAASNEVALRVEPGAPVTLMDMRFRAVDATVPGGSSIAAIVPDLASASFVRCDLVAGDGAPGVDGAPGTTNGKPAKAGVPGHAGQSACSSMEPQGGAAVSVSCDEGLVSEGGIGGNGGPDAGFPGTDGSPGPASNPDGFGASGVGQDENGACSDGNDGAHGQHGQHGDGGHGVGQINEGGYFGADGQDGEHGLPGQGGGGGGGSRGGMLLCFKPIGGAAGGGGGTGGCGGRGGHGGMHGGASIGLLLGDAGLKMTGVALITGRGGDGGSGGMYQSGGQGGIQGAGGKIHGQDSGCAGGNGGNGGNGGYGGGGAGGPSVGIAHTGTLPDLDITYSQIGKPGRGGWGGNPYLTWTNGDDGVTGVAYWWK
jgi:hypothetical protein